MTNDPERKTNPRRTNAQRGATSPKRQPTVANLQSTVVSPQPMNSEQPVTGGDPVTGILQLAGKSGVLRDPTVSLQPTPTDVAVPAKLIQQHGLVAGVTITGLARRGRQGNELVTITTVCGLAPDVYKQRTPFSNLVAISPNDRFNLSSTNEISMRIMDLIAPVGKGTRGLIVAPPKSGKTILLEQIARAIYTADPATRLILLLIDERPEEVTHFRRTLAQFLQPVAATSKRKSKTKVASPPPLAQALAQAVVFASSNDHSLQEHVALVELTMAYMRAELECGRNVVVLVDSLTRMARAYNLHGTGSRRTMSGGVDAGALEMPRRFFGLARNIEKGGSITIIATALIETGSRMDDLIFQEFKGTGNSELVLDRELAEARIFPAINLLASSTRNDQLLYNADDIARLAKLRRWLASGKPKQAMNGLLKLIEQTKDNDELLRRIRLET